MTTDRPASDDLEAKLRAELASAEASVAALEAEYADVLADPGVIQEDRDTTRRVLEEARGTRDAAQRALDRLTNGTYGRCITCGQPIPPERLEAIPDAETCVSCSR
jgi:RNA polymerase-binding transcription factor DksA